MNSPLKTPRPTHVAIVGGGLAGLASAVALANRGLKITLLESRPRLGGRASSFTDPSTGDLVDNCQHVSMTCCTNLADFCSRVGTLNLFRKVPSIVFLSPEGRRSTLKAGFLPTPLHLSGSFLSANYLTLSERLRVAWGLTCLRFARPNTSEPFASWLLRHGQTPRTIDRYWSTVLVSALNERLDRMDVGHARKVFLDGFLRARHSYVMEVPTVPLGELYGTRLESWLRDHGIDVLLKTGVRSVETDEQSVSGLVLRDGSRLDADFVVLSAPFNRVLDLLGPSTVEKIPALASLDQFQSSPITGVHLWFDREVCPLDHAVIVGRTVQWVFNRTGPRDRRDPAESRSRQGRESLSLDDFPPGATGFASAGFEQKTDKASGTRTEKGQYLQLVISASYDLAPRTNDAILQIARDDLAALWPASKEAQLLRWRVVTEHGATFSVRPGVESLRPPQRTPIDGLFLAGDWTSTGWPATMEGAVRSGYLAAEGILSDLGRPTPLVRPDLPAPWLSRLLLGRPQPVL